MGNGQLNQQIGYGGATVWNPNVAVQNFGNILAQKKKQEEADNAAIAAELSKVKSDGLRNDADRQYFLNKYNEIKNNAIATAGERNSVKKALAQAQTKDALLGLQQYVQRSKAQGAAEHSFGQQYMSNPTPWSDEAIANYRKSIAAPLDSSDVIKDFTTQQRLVDHAKVDQGFTKMDQDALNKTQWGNDVQEGKPYMEGGRQKYLTAKSRQLSADQILANAAHLYDIDRNVQHSLDQRYANIQGDNADETKMLRVRQNAIDRGAITTGPNGELVSKVLQKNTKVNNWYTDPYYAHKAYAQANSPDALQTPAQTLIAGDPSRGIAGMQQGNTDMQSKFINLAPTYQYGGKSPSISVDPNTGEHVFNFPAQIVPDKAAANFNKKLKADYALDPEKTDGNWFGGGKKVIPFEKSTKATLIKPEVTIKHPQETYKANPVSPDYLSKIAEIAKEQNINLSQLNQIEGKKANRGQIDQAVRAQNTDPVNKHKKAATDYGL